jgi:dethiobiotin synthetase
MPQKLPSLFISGTDTDVGKTVVTALLAQYLQRQGYRVATQKWVQTGCANPIADDISVHQQYQQSQAPAVDNAAVPCASSPYIFKTPCSPHLASQLENRPIKPAFIRQNLNALTKQSDAVLIEGSGGILVPLTSKLLLIDLVQKFHLPVLLVVGNKLGAINQALLTIEALQHRNIDILGLVCNNYFPEADYIQADNPKAIAHFSKQTVFGTLPYLSSPQDLSAAFQSIGAQICRKLKKMQIG